MANEISFDIPPGYYLTPQTLNMRLAESVQSLQYSVNAGAPAISKYIAYDTLNPPQPFIAVTQDGKGNVVYDGGFPKFYSTAAPAANTPASQLNATFKYFHNALKFISNKDKAAAGNKKILIIGDQISSGAYSIKSAANNGFFTTLSRLAAILEYEFTYKDRADWTGGKINPTVSELEAYAAVVVFSTLNGPSSDQITVEAIDALMTYRENGNGMMLITDHGPVLPTIESAISNRAGFFATANLIAVNLGTWFSGDYNRSPVNVGHIRSTYGDHPLYEGMLDTESIYAGGSESRVFVADFSSIAPEDVPPIQIGNGRTVIQVAATLDNGEIVTYRATYYVVSFKLSFTDGKLTVDNGQRYPLGIGKHADLKVAFVGTVSDALTGEIFRNNVKIGTVSKPVQGEPVFTWTDSTPGIEVNDGDELKVVLGDPLPMQTAIIIDKFDLTMPEKGNIPDLIKTVKNSGRGLEYFGFTNDPTEPSVSDISIVEALIKKINEHTPGAEVKMSPSTASNLKTLRDWFNS